MIVAKHFSTLVTLSILVISLDGASAHAKEEEARSFELRYFSAGQAANGVSDFKGESEVFNTEERVQFLKTYAEVAKAFFDVPRLDEKVVSDDEAHNILRTIKPQPRPELRTRIPLDRWKWKGYREGAESKVDAARSRWSAEPGVRVDGGRMVVEAGAKPLRWTFPSQSWRFSISWKAKVPSADRRVTFEFSDKELVRAARLGFGENGRIFYSTASKRLVETDAYPIGEWVAFKAEFDMAAFERGKDVIRYNLYVDDRLVADYVPMERVVEDGVAYATNFTSLPFVNTLIVEPAPGLEIDDLWGIGYALTGRDSYPYTTETFLDENFEAPSGIEGWLGLDFDDSRWEEDTLPFAHGGERYSQEDLYLRSEVSLGEIDKAYLNIETVDPSGEIFVNGKAVAVIDSRHPQRLEISRYLKPNQKNLICVKVDAFYLTEQVGELMPHSSLDFNIGWFAGRMSLDILGKQHIVDAFLYTESINDTGDAEINLRLSAANEDWVSWRGHARLSLTPWFPEEGNQPAASLRFPLEIGHGEARFEQSIVLPDANLWTPETPQLYKARIVLEDEDGTEIDDWVGTMGARTVDQQGGSFRLNGKVAMANGAQTFGYRAPLETMLRDSRAPPEYWIIKEIMMIKRMNGNLLRTHVHGWEFPARGVNDPRYAEFADQLGIMLLWCPTSWVRTGRGWGDIDFDGFPKYIKQVRNHPSIIMWEAANHTQSFKDRPLSESNLYVEKAYQTIYPADPSRIISYNSFIYHFHYGNDAGTIDHQGNAIEPSPAWTAPMVTRGNQDSPTGYGNSWEELRKWPGDYRQDFLDSPERAYFNFEHQESIGQPNWNLVKGKPWYRLHSYEWRYDEGSIGRRLSLDEWEASQAWQAFSAWEAMKKMRHLDYDGFSWCCLHGGPNSVTYKKPLIDFHDHAKLAWYANKMVFQKTVAGSADVDVVYGPDDSIAPVVLHWGEARVVDVEVLVRTLDGTLLDKRLYRDVRLPDTRVAVELEAFTPKNRKEGYLVVEYQVR